MRAKALVLCGLVFQIAECLDISRALGLQDDEQASNRRTNPPLPPPRVTPAPYERILVNEDKTSFSKVEETNRKKHPPLPPPRATPAPYERTYEEEQKSLATEVNEERKRNLPLRKSRSAWEVLDEVMGSLGDRPDILEGDIYMPPKQRQATDGSGCAGLWDMPIRYAFDDASFSNETERTTVRESFEFWSNVTCVTFMDITSDSAAQSAHHHIQVIGSSSGCWASAGKTCDSADQKMNLESPGCLWESVILHEIGHALGLYHEQSRTDRDKYVRINKENVKAGLEFNFDIQQNTLNHGKIYDYTSIMHYGRTAFSTSKPTKQTIETKDPAMQFVIGSQEQLSFYDIAIVNNMYGCGSSCSGACNNGGYFDAACTCNCPPNYSGSSCDTKNGPDFPPMYDSCGNQVITSNAMIKTLNFPGEHPAAKCFWHIKPPKGKVANIKFTKFEFYSDPAWEHVLVLEDAYNGKAYAGTQLLGKTMTSKDKNGIIVWWETWLNRWTTGFEAEITMTGGAEKITKKKTKEKSKKKNKKDNKKKNKKKKKSKKSKKNKKKKGL